MLRDTLLTLLNVHGATGHEEPVAQVLSDMLAPYADDIRTDVLGSLIVTRRGEGKRILFSAHMDHIGFIVTDADEDGFLRVNNVGGIHVAVSLGQHVVFENGVQGVIFAQDDADGEPKMDHLFIDIGAQTREEAFEKVTIGDVAVYAPAISLLGEHRIAAPAMDDRVGCALLAELIMQLDNCPNEIVAVFSAQEEVGLRGAKVAAYAEAPDYGIALDVTSMGDTPGVKPKMAVKLGKGPAIKVMDRASITSPVVKEAMVTAAKSQGIPYQMEVLTFGGTDAGAIQLTRGGIPSGTLSIPTRYVHSAAETVDMRDMDNGLKLLLALVRQLG